MRSTPWFLPAPIAKACPTKKPCAGSPKPVELSLTPSSSGLSSPSRRRRCPPYSLPPALRFPQPCRHRSPAPLARGRVTRSVGKQNTQRNYTLEPGPKLPNSDLEGSDVKTLFPAGPVEGGR